MNRWRACIAYMSQAQDCSLRFWFKFKNFSWCFLCKIWFSSSWVQHKRIVELCCGLFIYLFIEWSWLRWLDRAVSLCSVVLFNNSHSCQTSICRNLIQDDCVQIKTSGYQKCRVLCSVVFDGCALWFHTCQCSSYKPYNFCGLRFLCFLSLVTFGLILYPWRLGHWKYRWVKQARRRLW